MNVFADIFRQISALGCTLFEPVETCQFQIVVGFFCKSFHQLVYIPFGGCYLIVSVCEIQRLPIKTSPVGLTGDGRYDSKYNSVFE